MLDPIQTIQIFQKQPDPKVFSAGQIIFKEGQIGDFMYGIVEGEIELVVQGKVVETVQSGDVFGVGGLVGVGNRTYTAIAKTNSQLVYLDEKRFLFAVQETPLFALKVMKSYSERLTRLEQSFCSE